MLLGFVFLVKGADWFVEGATVTFAEGVILWIMFLIYLAYLSISAFLLLINIPIFLFGAKKQGFPFTVYSVFTVAMYPLFSYLIVNVFPIDVDFVSPLAGSDLLLCAIFGGVISGIGSGLSIRLGGAIDGMDVLSVIFSKKLGLSIGTFVMIFNAILYIVCGFGLNSWILPLYSIITYFVASKTIDFIVDGFNMVLRYNYGHEMLNDL